MQSFEHDGLRLAYDVVGDGPPVILHTGAGGDSGMWRGAGYVDGLSGFTAILFDHRGHGESAAPAEPTRYSVDDHVGDVVALADHLGLDRFAFWGYSAGGRVGFGLGADEPGRLTALVAQGTVDPEGADDAQEWLDEAAAVREHGLAAVLGDEEIAPWLLENLLSTDSEVVAAGFECFAGWTPWPLFPRIAAPTLIVAGELEDAGCAEAAARMRDGRAVILPGLDHVAAFARSDAVLPQVVPFLYQATRNSERLRKPGTGRQ